MLRARSQPAFAKNLRQARCRVCDDPRVGLGRGNNSTWWGWWTLEEVERGRKGECWSGKGSEREGVTVAICQVINLLTEPLWEETLLFSQEPPRLFEFVSWHACYPLNHGGRARIGRGMAGWVDVFGLTLGTLAGLGWAGPFGLSVVDISTVPPAGERQCICRPPAHLPIAHHGIVSRALRKSRYVQRDAKCEEGGHVDAELRRGSGRRHRQKLDGRRGAFDADDRRMRRREPQRGASCHPRGGSC